MFGRIKTTEEFIDYGLRKLGKPVINIELDPMQISDRLDDAVQRFSEYHYDGFSEGVLVVEVEKNKREYKLSELVDGSGNKITDKVILSVLYEVDCATINDYFMNLSFSVLYNPILLYNSYKDFDNFFFTATFMDMLKEQFLVKSKVTFNYTTQTLTFLHDPKMDFPRKAFKVFYIDSYKMNDDGDAEFIYDIFNNAWLKEYFVALLGVQWGVNISKYDDVKLTGGGKLNGDKILNYYMSEKERIEKRMDEEYLLPPRPFMG